MALAAAAGAVARPQGDGLVAAQQVPLPTGCERHGPSLSFNGPRGSKRIAIGFDDGPAADTPGFLRALQKLGAHATFFEIGEQVPGNGKLLKRILATGNEIGNHTTHHGAYPSAGDMRQTQNLIERASGFTPCVFRPPYGSFNSGTVAAASHLDMTTVIWDVDPRDWSTPGTGAIRANVVGHAHPGAIVVMHDGGGPRSETLAALPGIVRTLKKRGYSFVTISELLGNKMIYPGENPVPAPPPPPPPTPLPPPPIPAP